MRINCCVLGFMVRLENTDPVFMPNSPENVILKEVIKSCNTLQQRFRNVIGQRCYSVSVNEEMRSCNNVVIRCRNVAILGCGLFHTPSIHLPATSGCDVVISGQIPIFCIFEQVILCAVSLR